MKTVTQKCILLSLLIYCMSTTTILASAPVTTRPSDQAIDMTLSPIIEWTGSATSYTVELYNCNPDYSKVGKFLNNATFGNYQNTTIQTSSNQDLSGITYNPYSNTFFGVVNGEPEIVEIKPNGTVERTISLAYQVDANGNYDENDTNPDDSFDDTEGIAWIGGTEYLILEEREGRISKININSSTTSLSAPTEYIDIDIIGPPNNVDWDDNDGLEGIGYNPATNEVTVVKEKNSKEMYVFMLPSPFTGTVSVSSSLPTSFSFNDLSGVHHFGTSTGLDQLNISNHFLVLSEASNRIVELDENGVSYGELNLAGYPGEPEGITVDKFGNIFIAAEPSNFYKLPAVVLDLNPFNLSSSPIYSHSAVSGNSFAIPSGVLSLSTEYCMRIRNNDTGAWSDYTSFTTGATPCSLQEQYEGLRAVYLYTDGDNWSGNSNANWPSAAFFNANPIAPAGMTFSNWGSISVNADGCVTDINFDDEGMVGTIPAEIGNLTSLETLDFGSNNFGGIIPAEFGNLTNLTYLVLNNNNFTGNIPVTFGNLTSMEYMYMSYNNFFGFIPVSLGNLTNLKSLSIKYSQLSGPIPSQLGNLLDLQNLSLGSNILSGTIPPSLAGLPALGYLGLSGNNLSGCYDFSLQSLCGQLNTFTNTNTYISNGNGFDVPWEDFCADGTGGCFLFVIPCPTDLSLADDPLSTGTYEASLRVSSEGMVLPGGDIIFSAGDEIILDSGFSVEPGGTFTGETGAGCD